MSDIDRGVLAALLLEHELPDGATAARTLLDAELSDPVTMVTEPDMEAVPALWRSGWVKMATVARSTTSADVLERLARHSSVQVRRAAAENPALGDESRRALEDTAIAKRDTALVEAVLLGASWSYLVELLSDTQRLQGVKGVSWINGARFSRHFERSAQAATAAEVERIISAGSGDRLNMFTIVNDNVDRLALTTDTRLGSETQLLDVLLSSTSIVDNVYIEALKRLQTLLARPATIRRTRDLEIHPDLAETQVQYLLELHRDLAIAVFRSRTTIEVLTSIEQQWGPAVAATALSQVPVDEQWLPEVLRLAAAANSEEGRDLVSTYIDGLHPEPSMMCTMLKMTGAGTFRKYILGEYGEPDARIAMHVLIADPSKMRHGVSAYRTSGTIVSDIFDVLLEEADDDLFKQAVEHLSPTPQQAVRTLQRLSTFGEDVPTVGALSGDEQQECLLACDLDSHLMLTWLRSACSFELTIQFITNRLSRKMRPGELEALLEHPGTAFESRPLTWVLDRRFAELCEHADVATLDALVDAAGPAVLTGYAARHLTEFGKYVADRMSRSLPNSAAWSTGFDLLIRSKLSLGDTLRAASRLNRR